MIFPAPYKTAYRPSYLKKSRPLAGWGWPLGLFLLAFASAAAVFWVGPTWAQSLSLDLGEGDGSTTARIVQLVLLTTVLSLAPGILVTATSFTRIIIVFSFVRQALGTQTSPPNMVVVSLALFMTSYIMAPTFDAAWNNGVQPMIDGSMDEVEAIDEIIKPFHAFMMTHVREEDLQLFVDLSEVGTPDSPEATPLNALLPAFMISELRRAFEMGFLIYIPFIVIDMVIASVLMSMGMMMIPPIMLAMPFKLIFFVLIDGWRMLVGSLVRSFGT